MNVGERERALLALVEGYRDKECRRILDEAHARAAAMRREAFQRQRAALHERVAAERSRAQALVQAAEAERATRARRRSELRDAALVQAVWPLLEQALRERWAAADSRRAWVELALSEACGRLQHGGWQVSYPPDWPDAERIETAERIRARCGPARFVADGAISAGLVIAAGGALLDFSLAGLLRDRARLEARMLALRGTLAASHDGGAGAAPEVPPDNGAKP